MAGSAEVTARRLLFLVVQAGGEPVHFDRLLEVALQPEQVREAAEVDGIGRPEAQRPAQPMRGGFMFAGVGAEFLGEFLPEDRVGLRLGAQLLQQRQTVLPPGELAQTGKFGELRSAVIGKLFEQLVQAGEQRRSVLVVAREGPFGAEGEPMLRSIGLHLLEHDLSFGALVLKKRALQRMQSIEERRIGEIETVEQMRLSFRHERHAARPAGAVVLEESLRHCFARVILIRVANDQRAAQIVVTDDGLQVGARCFCSNQSERHAAIQQNDGSFPGHRELTRYPAVLLGPVAFAVGGRAVVANDLGDRQMLGRQVPEVADGREGGRSAGLVMLADEVDRQFNAAARRAWLRNPVGELLKISVVGLPGEAGRCVEFAAVVGNLRPLNRQPLGVILLENRRQRGDRVKRDVRVAKLLQIDLQNRQLRQDGNALKTLRGGFEQFQRFIVAVEELQKVGRGLDSGAIPRAQFK